MSSKFYIAVRDLNTIPRKLWETPRYLSGGLKKSFNKAAKEMGFNMSHNGVKLKFYVATQEEVELYASESSSTYVTLMHGDQWNPLFVVDMDKLRPVLQEIKKDYSSLNFSDKLAIFDFNIEKKYTDAIISNSTIIGSDIPFKREKKINENNIKVGDLINHIHIINRDDRFGIVTRISESGYWFDSITIADEYKNNLELFRQDFVNSHAIENWHNKFFTGIFSYEGNEDKLLRYKTKYKRWNKFVYKTDDIEVMLKN